MHSKAETQLKLLEFIKSKIQASKSGCFAARTQVFHLGYKHYVSSFGVSFSRSNQSFTHRLLRIKIWARISRSDNIYLTLNKLLSFSALGSFICKMRILITRTCWRRSLRRHDFWLTLKLDPGNRTIGGPYPPPLSSECLLFSESELFQGHNLGQQCVEPIWMLYMTQPH